MGPPWGTTWFKVRGEVPAEWAGRRVEAVFDLGFVGDWPGNQAEALVHTLDGSPLKAVNPQNQYVPVPVANPASGGERVDYLVEAASNPDILANDFRGPTPLGDKATAGMRAAVDEHRPDATVVDIRMPPTLKDRVANVAAFMDALSRVAAGGTALDPEVVTQLASGSRRTDDLASLTAREREVLSLMAEGRSNTAIAHALVGSAGTVEKHVAAIFGKLGLPSSEDNNRRVLAVIRYLRS